MMTHFQVVKAGRQLILALPVLAFGLSLAAPAFSQSRDLRPILDRLQRIERDIKTLNVQVSQGGAPVAVVKTADVGTPAAARIAVRLTSLEDELRATTGTVEQVANQIDQIRLRLDKLVADLDYRLSAIENGTAQTGNQIAAAPSPAGVQKVVPGSAQPGVLGVMPQSELAKTTDATMSEPGPVTANVLPGEPVKAPGVLPEGTVKERYSFAFDLLRKANYDQAEVALKEFMEAHSDDALAGNARYWLAESYYVRGQYVQAAEAFVTGYQANATGPKAPDMLLKLGMSMSNLDKKAEACASFGKLLKDFPEAPERILSKVSFESNKMGCE